MYFNRSGDYAEGTFCEGLLNEVIGEEMITLLKSFISQKPLECKLFVNLRLILENII
jgi:hypothetical protein